MRSALNTSRKATLLGIVGLLLLLPRPGLAEAPPDSSQPVLGRLLTPNGARVVVRREPCRCGGSDSADILLLTLGTESQRSGETHFHPLAALAFDRSLGDGDTGQWLALWTFGPSPAGWRRNLRSLVPLPVGTPQVSPAELERLETQLAAILESPETAALETPDPVVHLAGLGRASPEQGIWGGVRRGMSWANVVNPAQFMFRTYLLRRKDRRERDFQRTYLALQWLLDVEFNGATDPTWLATLNELRFHLLRNRSFFGRWVEHADAVELVYNYESDIRRQLGKTSSWLQSAANEHYLRYQPIYRYSRNGAAFPMGGVLYYDPRLGPPPDPGWWRVANPFDLPYNPHEHPEVQKLAREHPDELIPLAVYTFQTNLALRPIIAIDFFAPDNPRTRERTHQLMLLAKQWLAITTGALSPERIPFRVLTWAANKKGFTFLVDKSSRLGIEELRVALESDLYFDPALHERLLERADQRVLNPLVKPGPVEERLAHIQYESLRARQAQALCRTVNEVRQVMMKRLRVPGNLPAAEQEQEFVRRLRTWHQQVRLEDFVAEPLGDFGSLGSLEAPLRYFLSASPIDAREMEELLAELYAKLYRQQLDFPPGRSVAELDAALELTEQVWEKTLGETRPGTFEARRQFVKEQTLAEFDRAHRRGEEKRAELLRKFLENSHKELARARGAGCNPSNGSPAELEAHLTLLAEVAQAASADQTLRLEFRRHTPRLRRELQKVETALGRCPAEPAGPEGEQFVQNCLELARHLQRELYGLEPRAAAGGE